MQDRFALVRRLDHVGREFGRQDVSVAARVGKRGALRERLLALFELQPEEDVAPLREALALQSQIEPEMWK